MNITTLTTHPFLQSTSTSANSLPLHSCADTKDKISIATGVLSFLLLVSELLPYFPIRNCNGILQALQCLIKEHAITPNSSLASFKTSSSECTLPESKKVVEAEVLVEGEASL
jgi:hypothetical protein